jgi:hypothetical protein
MSTELASWIRWHAWLIGWHARKTWRELPGPTWVKIITLVIIGGVGALIPGPWDELIMIAGVRAAARLGAAIRVRLS